MNRHRLALLALAALLPLTAPAQQMPLNDTGQERCYDGAELVECSEANTGDATLQVWGLLLLGTLLGWVGWRTQRRRIG